MTHKKDIPDRSSDEKMTAFLNSCEDMTGKIYESSDEDGDIHFTPEYLKELRCKRNTEFYKHY